MDLIILHLSDIHIKQNTDPILQRSDRIAQTVFPFLPECKHLILLFSGDIAFSGKTDEYLLAKSFIESISKRIISERQIPITIVTTPGNHDNNFDKNDGAREILVDQAHRSPEKIDNSIIKICCKVQEEYFDFRNQIEAATHIDPDSLWRSTTIEVDGQKIAIESLNISWISKIKEEQGMLLFPFERYNKILEDEPVIRISTMHHPLNWFHQANYRPFRIFIKKISDILITGHEHCGNAGTEDSVESDQYAFVEGCVLQDERGDSNSGYNIIAINTKQRTFLYKKFEYKKKIYQEIEDEKWCTPRPLADKARYPFQISSRFKSKLEDPGGCFSGPNGQCPKLSDVYVFPDIRKVKVETGKAYNTNISSECLISLETIKNGVLLEGGEKAGSTSLLYQLYLQFHDRGLVPIYLNGLDISKITTGEINAAIRRQFIAQYDKTQWTRFEQLSKSKKILLLDDFEQSPIKKNNLRADAIIKLKERFGYMIITVDNMFELKDILDNDLTKQLSSLEHYKIQPLGHVKRSLLIEKWMSLDPELQIDDAEFVARCNKAERLANTILTKSLIPTIPLHLLTLLQSLSSGRSSDFQDSALGYYYQFLLTAALQNSGVPPENYNELFQYCSHLAWEFHKEEATVLPLIKLREFNGIFCREFSTVEFEPRIKLLVKARILEEDGENYNFRYPYMYYFLKGLYIKDQINDPGMKEYIARCCNHLYVRDHANTILFLVHHTNDDFVLQAIIDSLRKIFTDNKALNFLTDTAPIKEFIKAGPDLKYDDTKSPSFHRKHTNEMRDQMDSPGDGLAEIEEKEESLSLSAQLIMMFKTNEILGQVLKAQYSKIRRPRKNELISEMFNGPLRALDNFMNWICATPDTLIEMINMQLAQKGHIKSEEEGRQIAKQVIGGILQLASFAFINKTARDINHDKLIEDVNNVVAKSGNFSYKIIDLCIKLDSNKPIPKHEIESITKSANADILITHLVQIGVFNRLYLFETSKADRTWLAEKKIIPIKDQQTIEYRKGLDGLA